MNESQIPKVRRLLIAWAASCAPTVMAHAGIVARNLVRLEHDPSNLPLRIQTMKNVEELERAVRANQ